MTVRDFEEAQTAIKELEQAETEVVGQLDIESRKALHRAVGGVALALYRCMWEAAPEVILQAR